MLSLLATHGVGEMNSSQLLKLLIHSGSSLVPAPPIIHTSWEVQLKPLTTAIFLMLKEKSCYKGENSSNPYHQTTITLHSLAQILKSLLY